MWGFGKLSVNLRRINFNGEDLLLRCIWCTENKSLILTIQLKYFLLFLLMSFKFELWYLYSNNKITICISFIILPTIFNYMTKTFVRKDNLIIVDTVFTSLPHHLTETKTFEKLTFEIASINSTNVVKSGEIPLTDFSKEAIMDCSVFKF